MKESSKMIDEQISGDKSPITFVSLRHSNRLRKQIEGRRVRPRPTSDQLQLDDTDRERFDQANEGERFDGGPTC